MLKKPYVHTVFTMCPHAANHVSTGKKQPVVNIIHHCMQSGTYRFPKPEVLFTKALKILRENTDAAEWLTDKGQNNVDDNPEYTDFRDAVEEGIREVALSGSRLFKKGSMKTKNNWQRVDQWRKTHAVLFLLRYVLKPCVLML